MNQKQEKVFWDTIEGNPGHMDRGKRKRQFLVENGPCR